MTSLQREGRKLFLSLLCGSWVALVMAVPLVSALEPASAGAPSRATSFVWVDRNLDGFVALREAGGVPGLRAAFARADADGNGRLDQVEYARALALLEAAPR